MFANAQFSAEINPAQCDRILQSELILRLIRQGNEQADKGKDSEAIRSYYSIFQPGLGGDSALGLRRVAPIELYAQAAKRLRVVASRHAARLAENRCFLAGDPSSGNVGVPRGALNLYLISNQYASFDEFALRYAAEEFGRRDIKRFLMSSVRARVSHLRSVQRCAPLLDEERNAFLELADFEARLHAHLLPLRHEHANRQSACNCAPETASRPRYI